MVEYTDIFNTRALTEQFRKLEQDDYNHAIADVDVGRMRKHIPQTATNPITGRKETTAERFARTLQWLLLNDENYARAHKAAVTAVNEAFDAAANALSDIKAALKQTSADIEDILNRAATLPDGRKVFPDRKGNVVDENGNRISDELADSIIWRGDEPTYDEYRAQLDRADDLRRAHDEILGIETELGGYQGDLSDDDNPPSPDRLDDIKKRSDDLRDRINEIEASVSHEHTAATPGESQLDSQGNSAEPQADTVLPTIKIGS